MEEKVDVKVENSKIHKCSEEGCNAQFQKRSKLIIHLRRHTGERPYICDECNKTYINDSHLRRHKKTAHPSPELKNRPKEVIICPHEGCTRQLANVYSLKKHVNLYHNPMRKYTFECEQCNAGFLKKSQLNVHMTVHTGKPPYSCESCNMGFNAKTNYSKHLAYHKTFECECSMTFTRWSLFCVHKRNCDKCIKIFQCQYCNKEFQTKNRYRQHLDSHLIEKPKFFCTYDGCSRAYKYERNLRVHINSFHKKIKIKKYKCTEEGCESMFYKRQNLNYHLQLHANPYRPRFPRNRRKDAGTCKKSTGLKMTGLSVPYEAEKMLLEEKNPNIYLNSDTDGIYTSDTNTNSDATDNEHDIKPSQNLTDNNDNNEVPTTSGLHTSIQIKSENIADDNEPNCSNKNIKQENVKDFDYGSSEISEETISSHDENDTVNDSSHSEIHIKSEPMDYSSDEMDQKDNSENETEEINRSKNVKEEPNITQINIKIENVCSDNLSELETTETYSEGEQIDSSDKNSDMSIKKTN